LAHEWGERIPVGLIYRNDRPPFESHFSALQDGPLVGRDVDRAKLKQILKSYE
jgi:2-oxoglutarate ferredoxin oxidoreductase subunit beta